MKWIHDSRVVAFALDGRTRRGIPPVDIALDLRGEALDVIEVACLWIDDRGTSDVWPMVDRAPVAETNPVWIGAVGGVAPDVRRCAATGSHADAARATLAEWTE